MAYTTIDKPSDYFNTKLYTGTGNSHAITGVGFDPNWVWLKSRSTVQNNLLFDTVRGATKKIMSNTTDEEQTEAQYLKSFDSDGFTLGTRSEPNESGETFVSWNWKAGTSVSGTTSGSGTGKAYSGSVSTAAGFSIITYLGNGSAGHSIPHHLGVTPEIIITKRRSNAGEWYVYSPVMGNTKHMRLNRDGAEDTANTIWNNTSPTSSVFTVGTNGDVNGSNNPIIAYCFNSVQGYSKFGSYQGNSQTGLNAPFIYLGFKPAWLMVKKYTGGNHWIIWDNKRSTKNGNNIIDKKLYANLSHAENGAEDVSFLSNGFKLNTNTGDWNENEGYIFMAFAESPFVSSSGVPATAG